MWPPVESEVEVSVHGEDVVPGEGHSVAVEAPVVALLPSRIIEVVELVLPHEIEALVAPVV